ncbi:hypothetical protein [Mucilaginibacter sp.]|uniref:hypothetical protein n=1 Tax=Mucilaginibacter sp. TaxID=1882438 RepID=UPI00284FA6D0|nr:hypothetical protein [Mucilaginibacter sp.]MDR3694132.1 hypothetical protein [Mucilaginibacter sp.]
MKAFAFVLLTLLLPGTPKIIKNSPLQLKYDKVMMYNFNGGIGSDMSIVDARGHIAKSMKKQVVLDNESALSLTRKLGEKESFDDTTAACFEPGLGFVYYLKGKIVAHITVCLSCNVVTSSIPLDPQKHDKFWANNDYLAGWPSKSFRAFLMGLLKKYNF